MSTDFNDTMVYQNYIELEDGSIGLDEERTIYIAAFQPVSDTEVVADDGSISYEYLALAENQDNIGNEDTKIQRGSRVKYQGYYYIVSGMRRVKSVIENINHTELTLRKKHKYV